MRYPQCRPRINQLMKENMHSLLHLVGDHYGNLIGYVAIHRLTKLEGGGFRGSDQNIKTAKLTAF